MQSHQSTFGKDNQKNTGAIPRVHQRQQSLGKAMPVTSLLLNFPPLNRTAYYTRHERSPEYELPPLYFDVNESMPQTLHQNTSKSAQQQQQQPNDNDEEDEFEFLVSDCSDSNHDDNNEHNDEPEISLVGNSKFYTPCLTCTQNAPEELATRPSAINEMCRRLCTDECRLRLSLAGFEPPTEATLKSQIALAKHIHENLNDKVEKENSETQMESRNSPALPQTRPPPAIAIQRKKFLMELLTPTDSDSDSNFVDENVDKTKRNLELLQIMNAIVEDQTTTDRADDNVSAVATDVVVDDKSTMKIIDPHEIALLKDFRERFEIAEALAKTSAMTSTSKIKQRLAARKLEIELETKSNKSAGIYNAAAAAAADDDDNNDGDDDEINCGITTLNSMKIADAIVNVDGCGNATTDFNNAYAQLTMMPSDIVATVKQQKQQQQQTGNDFEPPRDLLLYLVRMGSFNSAPKINNIDSQDDGLEIPKDLNTTELIQYVKNLRGEHYPPLLSRYFLKSMPSLTSQLASSDITDGLRYLQLNSVSRVCGAPISTSPKHLRLLQWNILSQTLGQNNDGFVRCPEEALIWENRKFLIVQEILQNNPDIVCLQEVDHFKFLQTILGTQNYEGIFFPKPDSPCLYIEENNGPDGCAIFFKRDKFELKSYETRILEVWRVQSNQVAIAANLYIKALDQEICICTTHLKARHGALLSKLRNEQGRDLLRFVRNFAGEDRPVILCGDFNAEPIEPVYATILSCEKMNFSSAYADMRNSTAIEEIAKDNIEAVNVLNGNGAAITEAVNTVSTTEMNDVLVSEDNIQKSIHNEPPYTTWKIREDGEECHTIDYVFYAKNKFKVLNCLEFPHGEEIGKNRTPSFQYPSDHFSLVCDFEILDANHSKKSKDHDDIKLKEQ